MAKSKAPSILDVIPSIDNGTLQPVYYFFGEAYYLLQNVLDLISKTVLPLITSDFDKILFTGIKNHLVKCSILLKRFHSDQKRN